ncbi:hypothetical protein [Planctomyces sp. SH-PL62]|uniref:hypothetical protein n=1 Tax=Planctomyces sp. SH-PL62 TaxID=1636152 RepID=UPI00078BB94D|nr:hypothetical protein [Planctomyces sp. SH-PL62]AMV38637.1 hypothetical protein VT85_14460 [Planctomyces sp. SH-PL62]
MTREQPQPHDPQAPAAPEPKTRLGRILRDHPEARPRLGRAVGGLLGALLATLAAVGILLIWHLRRRADLVRDRLGNLPAAPLPDPSERRPEPDKDRPA